MFNGTIEKYTGSNYTIEIQGDIKPYHTNIEPIQIIQKSKVKKEVDRLVKI